MVARNDSFLPGTHVTVVKRVKRAPCVKPWNNGVSPVRYLDHGTHGMVLDQRDIPLPVLDALSLAEGDVVITITKGSLIGRVAAVPESVLRRVPQK